MSDVLKASIKERIGELLVAADYSPATRPLVIGGIPFDGLSAYIAGAGFLDLVVVLDGGNGDASRRTANFWTAERVARALDNVGSRRPLTFILMDETNDASPGIESLLRLGRVLVVDTLDTVEARLGPILPLILEPTTGTHADPLEGLGSSGAVGDRPFRLRAIRAARSAEALVVTEFERWLDEVFADEEPL